MRKNKVAKTFNLTISFVLVFLTTLFLTGILTGCFAFILDALGLFSFKGLHPLLLLTMMIVSCTILGAIVSYFISKRTFNVVNNILKAVSEIGKGNFDVEIETQETHEFLSEITRNINYMAKDLRDLEIMRKDFIQNFSHEFKTPIVSIQGFAKRLLTKKLPEKEMHEYLSIIYEESSRLSSLAENTLYMSTLETEERITASKSFVLDEQIRQCVLLLEKHWTKKEIKIILNVPDMVYHGNEGMIKQIWVNLLSNAIKFTDKGGKVTISACNNTDSISVCIADTGIGMSEETIRRIFDKYYQGDPSRTTEGNGLGMSIVRRIIDLAGGSIVVKSEANNGATFTVTLPKK